MYIGTLFVHLIISPLIASVDSCTFFFLSFFLLCVCAVVCRCVFIYIYMHGCAQECLGAQEYAGVYRSVRVFAGVREFSEFLPENRILTSADFNMYPIRIFASLLLLYRSMYLSTLEIYLKSMKKLNT